MFLGQSMTGRRNWKKGLVESVWSGDYSRYHVLHFLSFITMILPNILSHHHRDWGVDSSLNTHFFPFNKNGETVVGVRGHHDEMIPKT